MARKPLRPLIRSGGFYPSRKWTPLVYAGGYTTANGGEEPAPPPIGKTITGNPIHILDALAKPAQALSVKLEPVQDLNGYSYPWPAGGGKNLFDKGNIAANKRIGTAGGEISANDYFTTTYISVVVGTSYTKNSPDVNAYHRFCTYSSTNEFVRKVDNSNTITIEEGESYLRFCGLNTELDTTQLEIGTSSTTFAPYSNICPISGWTGANVYHSGADTSDATTYSITFPSEAGTVYGGTLDVTTGKLTVTHGNIASYSGETLPGRWISSMDVYSAGGTPTTGAQVVYELATPQTIQLTPQQVELLLGENNIWSDGEMTLTYLADGNASDEEALNILLGGRYVNNHSESEPTDREALNIVLGGNER